MQAMRLLGREVLPQVIAETLNETADAVTRRSLRYLQKRLTVRTKYTTNSLTRAGAKPYRALNKARGTNIQRMYSRAGSMSPYLATQDTGESIRGSKRRPIPTLNTRVSKSEAKSIAGRYNLGKMGDIAGDKRYFIGEPKGYAKMKKHKGGPLGLWERYNKNKKIRLLRDLSEYQVDVPGTNWHRDAADEMGQQRFIRARFKRRAQQRLQRMSNRRR